MTQPEITSPPQVSVLIPCHNAGAYLAATLDSVMVQDGVTWEAILVDDGSTDDSAAIAARYAHRLRVVGGPQRGASAARNLATSLARGAFFQYLDADDLLAPGALAARVAALRESGAAVAVSDWQRLVPDASGMFQPGPVVTPNPAELEPDPELAILKGFWAPPAALLYRREIVSAIGAWREDLPVIQDARFLFDAARAGGRIVHAPGVFAHYRQHASGSLSTSSATRFWADVLTNFLQIEQLWRESGRLDASRRAWIGQSYANLARTFFPLDEALLDTALRELARYPGAPRSRYLRAALFFRRLLGRERTASLLAFLRRAPRQPQP